MKVRLVLGVYDALAKGLKAKNFKLFYNVQQAVFNPSGGMGEEADEPAAAY
jgi:hypothetical protein